MFGKVYACTNSILPGELVKLQNSLPTVLSLIHSLPLSNTFIQLILFP